MGYLVTALPYLSRSWKLQFQTYVGGRKIRDIPEDEYRRLGFYPEMSIEEARKRRDQLNAQLHVRQHEEKRTAVSKRLAKEEQVLNGFLDARDVEEFEAEFLFSTFDAKDSLKRNKTESHWRKARRVLCEIKLEPEDWAPHKRKFYDHFARQRLSPSYLQKVIRILNMWGYFHARKYKKFFEPLPAPRGHERERISDRYYDKDEKGQVSDPITPDQLNAAKSKMDPEHWNWVFLTVWFGLRPIEVDLLHKPQGPRTWFIGEEQGVMFLAVYQTKLTAIPKDKRLKRIPCIFPEQLRGLEIVTSGEFRRPSHSRYIQAHFTEHTTLYGGRKGFSALMASLGQSLENRSRWMGHRTINRTLGDYDDRQSLAFTSVPNLTLSNSDLKKNTLRST